MNELSTMIQVVLTKEMTISQYKNIIESSKQKGWTVKAYQISVYSEPLNKEVK